MTLFQQFLRMFAYTMVANTLTPLPSDAVSVMLGYAANLYGAPLLLAILAGVTAVLVMDSLFYGLFRFFGGRLSLVEKIVRKTTVETYREKMTRNVGKTVLFLRFYPGPGILSPILAGALKVPFFTYLLYDLAGIGISNAVYVTIGDLFHASIETFLKDIGEERHVVSIVFIIVVGLAISWRVYATYMEKMTARRLRKVFLLLQHPDEDAAPDAGRPAHRQE